MQLFWSMHPQQLPMSYTRLLYVGTNQFKRNQLCREVTRAFTAPHKRKKCQTAMKLIVNVKPINVRTDITSSFAISVDVFFFAVWFCFHPHMHTPRWGCGKTKHNTTRQCNYTTVKRVNSKTKRINKYKTLCCNAFPRMAFPNEAIYS